MNGTTHEHYAKTIARLVLEHGMAPALRPLFADVAGRGHFIAASSMPDRVDEVAIDMPGKGPQCVVLGHNGASLKHFCSADGLGYRFLDDGSLSVAGVLVAAAAGVMHAEVLPYQNGLRPPSSLLTEERPFLRALREQPGRTIGTFAFSSAGEDAAWWLASARLWYQVGDLTNARLCAGFGGHYCEDTCMPQHAWCELWHGHAECEDDLEDRWQSLLVNLIEKKLVGSELVPAVADELRDIRADNAADLCAENAGWAVRVCGRPRDLPTCPGDTDLRISVRAIASTMRALEWVVAP